MRNDRIQDLRSGQTIAMWVGIVLFAVVLGATNAGAWADRLVGGPEPAHDPIIAMLNLLAGRVAWSPVSTAVAVLVALTMSGLAIVLWRAIRGRGQARVDEAARYLGRGKDVRAVSRANAAAVASRFGMDAQFPGVPLGRQVGGAPLFASWEDMHIDIWGPRTGKTTSRAIPAIMTAPGSVVVTSNKRDVVDATRDPRSSVGEVWVFDPQTVCGEAPTWWWNPLSYVTDEVRAAKLAGHFAAGSRSPESRPDAYFDPAGQDLLAGLLLAAAEAGRPIVDVYRWLTDPRDMEPVRILRTTAYDLIADQVEGVVKAPEKQRAGIYGTAQQMASCLTNRQVAQWVNAEGRRPEFSPADFVAHPGGTLYSLSREGRGNAGPLVTALTVAVVEAAEELATRSAGGRLSVPLLGVLDEAANVCRWADLPANYSFFGSRGIVLMTILQSWSQGVDVWGPSGMSKLWSSSNIRVLGGGVDEHQFLEHISKVLGSRDRLTSQVNHSKAGRSTTTSTTREPILDIAELASLDRGRAVLFASGARPTIIRTVPWWETPYAETVAASVAAHDPGSSAVIPLESPDDEGAES